MTNRSTASSVRARLREHLQTALKSRDQVAIAAVRSALSAIDNAEAADVSHAPALQEGMIAGGVAGLGAGEVPRRQLSEDQVLDIVLAEINERRVAAAEYEDARRHDRAARLHAEADVLDRLLDVRDA
jgi:uncharacterized protein YqeY